MQHVKPKKPDIDPLLTQIVRQLEQDKRSNYALSNVSGLSGSTLANWKKGKTKRPQSVSLQMAGRALGLEMRFVRANDK